MRNKLFFLTTIPGLEPVSHLELCEKWGRAPDFFDLPTFPECQFFRGGIEFEAPADFGLLLSHLMRSVSHFRIREKAFSAANEKELVEGLKVLPWKDYLAKGDKDQIKFTSKSSKLSRPNQIAKVFQTLLKPLGFKETASGRAIHVRLFRDQCNISFDCLDEKSYLRGTGSIASLRSSTASGLLRILLQGLQDPYQLIDPMCGAGSFLKEALEIHQPTPSDSTFAALPLAKENNNKINEGLKFFSNLPPSDELLKVPSRVIARDFNSKAVTLAKKNLSGFNIPVDVSQKDLFKEQDAINDDLKKVVVVNPPWGKRLSASENDILAAIDKKYQPWRLGYLMPARWKMSSISMQKVRDIPILNSGVENRFVVFQRT